MDWGTLLVVGILLLNLIISWWNARVAGLVWVETKQMGGFTRLVVWSAAIMSASGFAWCYTIGLLFGAYATQPGWIGFARTALESPELTVLLTQEHLLAGLQLGYVILVPGILLSGMVIWAHSVAMAWQRRDLASIGVAGWNSYAQVHNTMSAMESFPDALRGAGSLFSGRGGKGAGGIVVIAIVLISVVLGILTTMAIINYYAGRAKLPERREQTA